MEQIKVGDYVRTETGHIGKLNKISTYKINNKDKTMYLVDFGNITYAISYKDIVKHSPSIIDLIEEGDFVNGFQVMMFDDMYDKETDTYEDGLAIPIYDDAMLDCIEEVRPLKTVEIKSIVTKEQYEGIKYEVQR